MTDITLTNTIAVVILAINFFWSHLLIYLYLKLPSFDQNGQCFKCLIYTCHGSK